VLAGWLSDFAFKNHLSPNEAAKHLAALALSGLMLEAFSLVAAYAANMKTPGADDHGDFVRGCEVMQTTISTVNMMRRDAGQEILNERERLDLVRRKLEEQRASLGLES